MKTEEIAEDVVKIIRVELLKQAARHRQSATKKMRQYYQEQIDLKGMIDAIRLEVAGVTLEGLGQALTLEKVEKWREEQKEKIG